jgi:YVTN family beta-propeller protein
MGSMPKTVWLVRTLRAVALLTLAAASSCAEDTNEREPTGRIYATVSKPGEVVVLDDETHELVRTIKVGAGPAIILATPDRKKLYTANWADNSVSAIDVASGTARQIPLGGRPYVIAMAPDGKHLFAGLSTVNEIAVIETDSDSVSESFACDALPASIIVSPDSRTLYVAKLAPGPLPIGDGTLEALSATTGEVTKPKIGVGDTPAWITISKDGSKVYTLNYIGDDITVVDTDSWTVTGTIDTGAGSRGIVGNVTPDGTRLYVSNHGTFELIAIDTETQAIVQTIALDGKPVGVSFSSDGSRVYVTDFGSESKTESAASGLVYLREGRYEPSYAGRVSVFDVETGEPVGEPIVTGPGATSVVVIPPEVDGKQTP